MPSKGSRMVGVRLEPHIEQRIMETIARNNRFTTKEPWTISSWIRDAILNKLQHQERAKLQREKRSLGRQRKLDLDTLKRLATAAGQSLDDLGAGA